jgi:thiamine biosynthesis lipoprotein
MAADVDRRRFAAMGSDAHLVVVGADHRLTDRLVALVDELERRWSRFLPDSEVSRLNRQAGRALHVHPTTILLVERAVEAWHLTGGSFDPTVLGDVLRAGYERSLAGQLDGAAGPRAAGRSELVLACTDIVVDAQRGTVELPAGSGFDPGGIGKGLAADLVAEAAIADGAAGVCVNLGGDLRVIGDAPNGGSWSVAVEDPRRAEPAITLDVAAGAVSTSTTLRRTWTVDGARRHHLMDPTTGAPSDSDLAVMTVIAGAGWHAEILATACLLRGSRRAFDLLGDGTHGIAVTTSGELLTSEGIRPFIHRAWAASS